MTGGKIVEFGRHQDSQHAGSAREEEILLLDQAVLEITEADDEALDGAMRSIQRTRVTLSVIGLAWVAFCGWAMYGAGQPLPAPTALPAMVATLFVPLIMLAVAYLLLVRNSRTESGRYLDTSRALRVEADLLEARLGRITAQLATARQAMQDQAAELDDYGSVASANMEASAEIISGRATLTAQSAAAAQQAGLDLAVRMDALIRTMPELEERASRMAGQLMDNGHALSERIDTLESRLHALTELSDEARSRTLAATKSLTSQLSQLQESTRTASDEVTGLADLAAGRIDIALKGARTALDVTSTGLQAQAQALEALVDRSQQELTAVSSNAVASLADTANDVENRLHQINGLIEGQQALVSGLGASLDDTIGATQARFAALEGDALARSERLTTALAHLTAETQRIDGALASGGANTEKLIGCTETLLVALDSSARELDETFPKALRRFDERLDLTRALLDSTAPEFERLEAISEALLGRTHESEELLRGQGRRLTEWLESTQGGLEANREKVEDLRLALDAAHQGATRITDGAGPLLITALLRVKDTADQAAERARQALGRAIPEAAQALSDASEEAMQRAIGDRVTAQIEQVAKVAEEAVKAAHQASDRLMRQLLTISDTSATIEQRIEEAERASEARDRDNFARRSALLIESLNSTSIDVAKLMSNDVTDASWAAYLKGDRGVFTRRAVKLLDAGESREIAAHYDADAEFRDHVNRYIHDFESMLRIILSARDGNALGVAILSSDMGKLYVALAQAIERLRQ
ncbi:hypothetical protein [Sphingobium aromaticiconvertens]|uniref:hypothetical protein n=1 Tax=Sphingobium aromaticiconvertens TaxID=365341 RepID=UPI003016CA2E